MHIPRRRLPTLAVTVSLVALAACGGDDASGDDIGTGDSNGSAVETDDTVDTGAGEVETGDDDTVDTGAADDTSADETTSDGATGEPSEFLADELHPVELPESDTAVITLAGETYVFDGLDICRVSDALEGRLTFQAVGTGELADGSRTRLEVRREVVDFEQTVGSYHEWDYLQFSIEQESGGDLWSNAWNDTSRDEPGGPVSGDSDTLPLIRVIDDGTVLAASAVAELTHPPLTGEFDRTGEGVAEIALVCG